MSDNKYGGWTGREVWLVRNEDQLIKVQYGLWYINSNIHSEILEYGEVPQKEGYIKFASVIKGKQLYVWPITK